MPYDNGYAPSSGLADLFGPLQFLGDTLSKPAAALRGLLAGRPDQLANLIPFSDSLGITRVQDRTSGRDLLRQYGLAGPQDTTGNALGGLLAEFLTDPTMLMAGLGGMGKMTSGLSRLAGLGGKSATVGEVGGALGSRAAGLVPQGVKTGVSSAASKAGNYVDDMLAARGAPRVFTGNSQAVFPDAGAMASAPRGPFGASMGSAQKGADELAAQLRFMQDSMAGASADEAVQLASGLGMFKNASRGPFGADPSLIGGLTTAGQAPLMQRGYEAAKGMMGSIPGSGMARRAGQAFLSQPAGALIPELSLATSAVNQANEPDPMEMEMLMQMLAQQRRMPRTGQRRPY